MKKNEEDFNKIIGLVIVFLVLFLVGFIAIRNALKKNEENIFVEKNFNAKKYSSIYSAYLLDWMSSSYLLFEITGINEKYYAYLMTVI